MSYLMGPESPPEVGGILDMFSKKKKKKKKQKAKKKVDEHVAKLTEISERMEAAKAAPLVTAAAPVSTAKPSGPAWLPLAILGVSSAAAWFLWRSR